SPPTRRIPDVGPTQAGRAGESAGHSPPRGAIEATGEVRWARLLPLLCRNRPDAASGGRLVRVVRITWPRLRPAVVQDDARASRRRRARGPRSETGRARRLAAPAGPAQPRR